MSEVQDRVVDKDQIKIREALTDVRVNRCDKHQFQCRTKCLNGEELNKRNILQLIEKKERNKVEKHQDDTDRATCIKLANGS